MRVLWVIGIFLAVSIGGAVTWWMKNFPSYNYRYRMTVEVLVDGAVRSGSSVIGVRIDVQPKFGSAPAQVSRVDGEAVFVDLGGGWNLIALLAAGPEAKNVDYPYNVVPAAFGLTFGDRDYSKLAKLRGSRQLWTELLPTFMTFTDLNDPSSGRVVKRDEFEEAFGPGVQLRNVMVEVTPDPITRGIEQHLPLLGKPIPGFVPIPGSNSYVDHRPFNSFRWHRGLLIRKY